MTELDCYRHGCRGTLCKTTGDTLLECDECGVGLKESSVRRLSEDSGPLAELAETLLEKAE